MKKLNKIQDLLSRNDMREVQGGYGSIGGGCLGANALCHKDVTSPPNNVCCSGTTCKGATWHRWGTCQ